MITQKRIEQYFDRVPVVVIPNFFSPEECQRYTDLLELDHPDNVMISHEDDASGADSDKNINAKNFHFDLEHSQELHQKLVDKMMEVNESNYRFQELFVSTTATIAEYWEGCYRSWHYDGGYIDWDQSFNYFDEVSKLHFLARRLTAVIQLSDPADYVGGELEFFQYQHPNNPDLNKQGTLVIFASDMWHRVTEVKGGVRYSMAMFLYGEKF